MQLQRLRRTVARAYDRVALFRQRMDDRGLTPADVTALEIRAKARRLKMEKNLGLVIVDEQHRFGVHQRLALREKGMAGQVPHQLVMTATPIPRTAAMTVYGDLDVSVLDELPPGRTPILTKWANGPLLETEVWADGGSAWRN